MLYTTIVAFILGQSDDLYRSKRMISGKDAVMKYMATYDMMETMRNTNQWLGATAKSMAAFPVFATIPNPALQWLGAWGEVTERSFERMVAKPDWGLDSFTCEDGRDHLI
ncbi:MAG: hypothetical protein ABJM57_14625 [Lentilitoribacter sp.]